MSKIEFAFVLFLSIPMCLYITTCTNNYDNKIDKLEIRCERVCEKHPYTYYRDKCLCDFGKEYR